MAHELTYRRDGSVEFFYYGALPWHGLGTSVPEALNSDDALRIAQLEWSVSKQNLYVADSKTPLPGYKAVQRDDNQKVLGVVGENFKVIQNSEAFSIIDELVGSKEAIFHTAGSIREGRRVWALVKLPQQLVVTPDDVIDQYLLLANAHDGSQSLTIKFTPVRVVCNNTLTAALPEWNERGRRMNRGADGVYIRHTQSAEVRIEEAKRILGIAREHFEELGEQYKVLSASQLSTLRFDEYREKVFPLRLPSKNPTREEMNRAVDSQKRHHTIVENLYHYGAGAAPGTLWGAYNAVTEYVDHVHVAKRDGELKKNGLESALFGVGVETKARAFEEALALV